MRDIVKIKCILTSRAWFQNTIKLSCLLSRLTLLRARAREGNSKVNMRKSIPKDYELRYYIWSLDIRTKEIMFNNLSNNLYPLRSGMLSTTLECAGAVCNLWLPSLAFILTTHPSRKLNSFSSSPLLIKKTL